MARIIVATSAGKVVLTIPETDSVMRPGQEEALHRTIARAVAFARQEKEKEPQTCKTNHA